MCYSPLADHVRQESILFAISMCLRLFLAISAFSILTFTVHPDKLLQVLSKFGYKSMTGLSIATRMYPTIAADSGTIEDAMKARGVEFEDGNMIKKAKARAPVDDATAAQLDGPVHGDCRGDGGEGVRGGEEDPLFRHASTLRSKIMIGCSSPPSPSASSCSSLGMATPTTNGARLAYGLALSFRSWCCSSRRCCWEVAR